MGPKSRVPLMLASPNMKAKSQLFEPQESIKICFLFIKAGIVMDVQN
jgi:hypothetical protein